MSKPSSTPRPVRNDLIDEVARELVERLDNPVVEDTVLLPMIAEALSECPQWFGDRLAQYLENEFGLMLSAEVLGDASSIGDLLLTAQVKEWVQRNNVMTPHTIGDEVLCEFVPHHGTLRSTVVGVRCDIAQVLLIPNGATKEMFAEAGFAGYWMDVERLVYGSPFLATKFSERAEDCDERARLD